MRWWVVVLLNAHLVSSAVANGNIGEKTPGCWLVVNVGTGTRHMREKWHCGLFWSAL
jgi:hypothetical protein